jgi:hypothetical protein
MTTVPVAIFVIIVTSQQFDQKVTVTFPVNCCTTASKCIRSRVILPYHEMLLIGLRRQTLSVVIVQRLASHVVASAVVRDMRIPVVGWN